MVNQDDDHLTLAVKSLLQAANYLAVYSEEVEDDEHANYFVHQANLLRKLANEWQPPNDGWGKVVPFDGSVKMKSMPPDRPR